MKTHLVLCIVLIVALIAIRRGQDADMGSSEWYRIFFRPCLRPGSSILHGIQCYFESGQHGKAEPRENS